MNRQGDDRIVNKFLYEANSDARKNDRVQSQVFRPFKRKEGQHPNSAAFERRWGRR